MNNKEKFKILNFAELYGCNKNGFLEVVSQYKTGRVDIIDYQFLFRTKPLSEDTKKKIDVLTEKISELIKEHQFNFNNH